MRRIVMNILWIGLTAVISVTLNAQIVAGSRFGTTDAPDMRPFQCYLPQLAGLPQFLQTPPGTAVYRFSGNCSEGMTYRVEGKWTPTAPQNQPNATEAFEITGYEPFLRSRQPGGKISVLAGARCTRDPWLNNPVCSKVGTYLPDDIRAMWAQLEELRTFPWSQNVLSASDKTRLLAEYNRINKIDTAPSVATNRLPNQLTAGSPRILYPTPGQSFVERTPIPIRIAPPPNWNVTSYMVQLQRKDGRGNWILHTNLPVTAAEAHGTGYKDFGAGAPPALASAKGAWRMNAQTSYPNKSGVSNWVEFFVAPGPVAPAPTSKFKDRIVR